MNKKLLIPILMMLLLVGSVITYAGTTETAVETPGVYTRDALIGMLYDPQLSWWESLFQNIGLQTVIDGKLCSANSDVSYPANEQGGMITTQSIFFNSQSYPRAIQFFYTDGPGGTWISVDCTSIATSYATCSTAGVGHEIQLSAGHSFTWSGLSTTRPKHYDIYNCLLDGCGDCDSYTTKFCGNGYNPCKGPSSSQTDTCTSGQTCRVSNNFGSASCPTSCGYYPVCVDYTDSGSGMPGCGATPTCSDVIQNQGETGIDCGGPCTACPVNPTCSKTQCPLGQYCKGTIIVTSGYSISGPCCDGSCISMNPTISGCTGAGGTLIRPSPPPDCSGSVVTLTDSSFACCLGLGGLQPCILVAGIKEPCSNTQTCDGGTMEKASDTDYCCVGGRCLGVGCTLTTSTCTSWSTCTSGKTHCTTTNCESLIKDCGGTCQYTSSTCPSNSWSICADGKQTCNQPNCQSVTKGCTSTQDCTTLGGIYCTEPTKTCSTNNFVTSIEGGRCCVGSAAECMSGSTCKYTAATCPSWSECLGNSQSCTEPDCAGFSRACGTCDGACTSLQTCDTTVTPNICKDNSDLVCGEGVLKDATDTCPSILTSVGLPCEEIIDKNGKKCYHLASGDTCGTECKGIDAQTCAVGLHCIDVGASWYRYVFRCEPDKFDHDTILSIYKTMSEADKTQIESGLKCVDIVVPPPCTGADCPVTGKSLSMEYKDWKTTTAYQRLLTLCKTKDNCESYTSPEYPDKKYTVGCSGSGVVVAQLKDDAETVCKEQKASASWWSKAKDNIILIGGSSLAGGGIGGAVGCAAGAALGALGFVVGGPVGIGTMVWGCQMAAGAGAAIGAGGTAAVTGIMASTGYSSAVVCSDAGNKIIAEGACLATSSGGDICASLESLNFIGIQCGGLYVLIGGAFLAIILLMIVMSMGRGGGGGGYYALPPFKRAKPYVTGLITSLIAVVAAQKLSYISVEQQHMWILIVMLGLLLGWLFEAHKNMFPKSMRRYI